MRKILLTLDSGGSLGCQTAWHGITMCWTPGQPICVLHVCLLFIDLFQPVSLPTRLASPGLDYLISYSSWFLCWSASRHRDKIPQMNNLRDEGSFWAHSFRRSVLDHLVPSLRAGGKGGYYGGEWNRASSAWSLESRELEGSRRGIEDSTHPYKRAHSGSASG